jgi:hypothetical protein
MGNLVRKIGRLLVVLFLVTTLVGSIAAPTFAKPRGGRNDKLLEKDTSKSYVLPYAIVVLGVALGVIIVARPSTRFDQPKRHVEEDEED